MDFRLGSPPHTPQKTKTENTQKQKKKQTHARTPPHRHPTDSQVRGIEKRYKKSTKKNSEGQS